MTLFLNVALLVIGATATLSAFGGETWKKGSEPILERITARGWISLLCLVLALSLGVCKELLDERTDFYKKKATEEQQSRMEVQLQAATAREELANQRLQDLEKLDGVTQDRLGETKATLADVRKTLAGTREDLDEQSASAFVSSLANTNQYVRDMVLYVPLTKGARALSSVGQTFLPVLKQPACRDLVGVQVNLRTLRDQWATVEYQPDDKDRTHRYLHDEIPKVDSLLQAIGGPYMMQMSGVLRATAGRKGFAGFVYGLRLHPTTASPISASQLYSWITVPGVEIAEISATWPKIFKTKDDYDRARKMYPAILDEDDDKLPATNIDLSYGSLYGGLYMPEYCLTPVRKYFDAAFENALLVVVLMQPNNQAQQQTEEIAFKLKGTAKSDADEGDVDVTFTLSSTPIFGAIDSSFLPIDNGIPWPDSTLPTPASK